MRGQEISETAPPIWKKTMQPKNNRIPHAKLRFLQYLNRESKSWWADQPGAVLLGKHAKG